MTWVYGGRPGMGGGPIYGGRGYNAEPVVTTAQVPINKFAFGTNEWQPFRAALVNSSDCR